MRGGRGSLYALRGMRRRRRRTRRTKGGRLCRPRKEEEEHKEKWTRRENFQGRRRREEEVGGGGGGRRRREEEEGDESKWELGQRREQIRWGGGEDGERQTVFVNRERGEVESKYFFCFLGDWRRGKGGQFSGPEMRCDATMKTDYFFRPFLVLFKDSPTTDGDMQNGSLVGIYYVRMHIAYTFLHVWRQFVCSVCAY